MLTKHDITFFDEPDIFFVFLIKPPVRGVFSYHSLTPNHYDKVVGPVPVAEMNCRMPKCLFTIKKWCLDLGRVTRENTAYNGKFVNGDLIIIQKENHIHAGFYTDHYPLGRYESDLYPLLKQKRSDKHGFMYVDTCYLHPLIVKRILRQNA